MNPPESLFIRWTIHRPVTILMAFVALLVVGVAAYPRIPLQLMPPGISTGGVSIHIPVPDGTPEEVMEEVAKPAEDLLRTIADVREIFSSSSSNRCYLRVEFDPSIDTGVITGDIRERLDRAKLRWPEGVDRYNIWRGRMDADMPVYIVSVGLDTEDSDTLNDIFENVIQNRLLAIDGVARVSFWGLIDRRATIDLYNDRVAAHAVPLRSLIGRLGGDNVNVTCGRIRDGEREYLVRSIGKFEDFDEIRQYPVSESLRVEDIAEVGWYRTYKDRISRVNGLHSNVVVVHKDSIANTLDVCKRVHEALEGEIKVDLPRWYPGVRQVELHTFLDQGDVIQVSVDSLKESGAYGALFAVAVLYVFFRRVGVTLLVTVSIPFSLLITVVWIYFDAGSFNILSMMGLSLAVGMLVDNSIVVVENIVRWRDQGLSPVDSAVVGVQEVCVAVSLGTLTTVVVFLPMMFIGDPRFRSIYQEVGVPLCVSVLASLVVALVFIPQGVIVLQRLRRRVDGAAPAASSREPPLPRREALPIRWTVAIVDRCLRYRFESFVLASAIAASAVLAHRYLAKTDTLSEGSNRVEFRISLPKNLSLRDADRIFGDIERVFEERRQELELRSITSWFDARDGNLNLFFEKGVRVDAEDFFQRAKSYLPRIPDVRIELEGDVFAADRWGDRIRVFVRGNDFAGLQELGDAVRDALLDRQSFPEITDVVQARDEARDEVQVQVRRELAQHYGIDALTVSSNVAWAIRGAMLPDYETPDRELPFWIRYRDSIKENVDDLRAIPVYRPDGGFVRLENVADYAVHPGPGEIRRVNGRMTLAYTVESDTESIEALKARVRRRLDSVAAPEGFEISMNPGRGGFEADMKSTFFALGLAQLLVFFVMGILFESVILPFSVLFSIPYAFFGALWSLLLSGTPLDPGAMVGMIMLVGVVVNNAIVLVDAINRLRGGLARREAILEACRIRFRPIWMTALTTIFGLVPLVVLPQAGEGMDYKSMAIVLMGGLATSTFFTLFVVPLFYTLMDDLRGLVLAQLHSARG
jgi:HAE1 family hydrophobic/amphiphilic exporter-1